MNTEADFWTPDGWRRGPMPDPMQAAINDGGEVEVSEALKANGYYPIITFGDTDNYITNVSVSLHRHAPTGHSYVEVWGGDYQLIEFFVEPSFCAAFIVDKLPSIVHAYGLQDHHAVVGELKLLRKVFAAFVRHEHGEHVIDAEGEQTLEERRAANERWRQRQQVAAEKKKAKQAEDVAQ